MYDENNPSPATADLPDLDVGRPSGIKGWTHKIFSKAETIIPIILIILFLLFFSISFLHVSPNDIPLIGTFLGQLLGEQKTEVLIIGQPLQITTDKIVNAEDYRQRYSFRVMDPQRLTRDPLKTLKNYSVVVLDQSDSADKSIPKELALDLVTYVKTGGSLVIVADSGYRITGRPDAYGWVAVLKDAAPVSCDLERDNTRACEYPQLIHGVWFNENPTDEILLGIDQIPGSANLATGLEFNVFDITPLGEEWATIKDIITGKTYPGIVYMRYWAGKIVYFNYNQIGVTPEPVDRILTYLS